MFVYISYKLKSPSTSSLSIHVKSAHCMHWLYSERSVIKRSLLRFLSEWISKKFDKRFRTCDQFFLSFFFLCHPMLRPTVFSLTLTSPNWIVKHALAGDQWLFNIAVIQYAVWFEQFTAYCFDHYQCLKDESKPRDHSDLFKKHNLLGRIISYRQYRMVIIKSQS